MKKTLFLLLIVCLLTSFRDKQLVWVAIGDSITYLNNHPNETAYRIKKGYLDRVVEKLPNVSYVNQGHNGWKASDIADHIDSLGIVKADIYTVFLGTNDWWGGRPLGTIDDYKNAKGNISVYGSFRIIIDKLRRLNPQGKIILITPMQRNDFVYIQDAKNNAYGSYKQKNGQSLQSFAAAVIEIGRLENFPVVDLYHEPLLDITNMVKYKLLRDTATGEYKRMRYPAFINVPFDPLKDNYPYPEKAAQMTYDGLHPSDKGNAVIAKKIIEVFEQSGLPVK